MKLNQSQKAAMVLMTLGEDLAANILQYLTPKEVQAISSSMINLPQLSQTQLKIILDDCQKAVEECAILNLDTNNYLKTILVKSMGAEKASRLLDDLLVAPREENGLDMLNYVDPTMAAALIKKEHPQIIATILVHLNRDLAADVISLFDENLRNDVMRRIATFNGVEPSALQVLSESLSTLLHGQNIKLSHIGGIKTAAEIINLMKKGQDESIISALRDYDDELTQKIVDEMFIFENLLVVDDRSMQRLLKDIDNETLIIALKGASTELKDKVLKNMSQRAAAILIEDLENRPPVRMSQVDQEQKNILSIARTLAEAGEIILSKGDDEYV